jgi:hypothetical protein
VKLTLAKFVTFLVNYGQNENLLCVCEDLQNNPKNKKRLPESNDEIPVEETKIQEYRGD